MDYKDFLETTKVLRMLYGRDKAEYFFAHNITQFSQLFESIDLYVEKV